MLKLLMDIWDELVNGLVDKLTGRISPSKQGDPGEGIQHHFRLPIRHSSPVGLTWNYASIYAIVDQVSTLDPSAHTEVIRTA